MNRRYPHHTFEQDDLEEIRDLLTGTIRNPNNCISKGQLKQVAEQLLARKVLADKRYDRIRGRLDYLQEKISTALNSAIEGEAAVRLLREMRNEIHRLSMGVLDGAQGDPSDSRVEAIIRDGLSDEDRAAIMRAFEVEGWSFGRGHVEAPGQ